MAARATVSQTAVPVPTASAVTTCRGPAKTRVAVTASAYEVLVGPQSLVAQADEVALAVRTTAAVMSMGPLVTTLHSSSVWPIGLAWHGGAIPPPAVALTTAGGGQQ